MELDQIELSIGNFLSFQNPLRKLRNSNHSSSYSSKCEGAPRAHPRHAFTFQTITRAVVGILQFSERILKAEKISNRDADLRFELASLQSDLKRVRDIRDITRSERLKFNSSLKNP